MMIFYVSISVYALICRIMDSVAQKDERIGIGEHVVPTEFRNGTLCISHIWNSDGWCPGRVISSLSDLHWPVRSPDFTVLYSFCEVSWNLDSISTSISPQRKFPLGMKECIARMMENAINKAHMSTNRSDGHLNNITFIYFIKKLRHQINIVKKQNQSYSFVLKITFKENPMSNFATSCIYKVNTQHHTANSANSSSPFLDFSM